MRRFDLASRMGGAQQYPSFAANDMMGFAGLTHPTRCSRLCTFDMPERLTASQLEGRRTSSRRADQVCFDPNGQYAPLELSCASEAIALPSEARRATAMFVHKTGATRALECDRKDRWLRDACRPPIRTW